MGILALLKAVPALVSVGSSVYEAVTGDTVASDDQTPERLAAKIDALPPDQQLAIQSKLIEAQVALGQQDTDRFIAAVQADAQHPKTTARPEIARRAMGVIEIFSRAFSALIAVTIIEWLVRLALAAMGKPFPEISLWKIVAEAAPVAEMIWAPLLASFWVCASIVKAYIGARAADKAQQFEMQAGRPLESHVASIAAAGGSLTQLIKAIRGA